MAGYTMYAIKTTLYLYIMCMYYVTIFCKFWNITTVFYLTKQSLLYYVKMTKQFVA